MTKMLSSYIYHFLYLWHVYNKNSCLQETSMQKDWAYFCVLIFSEMVAALEWWSGTECSLYTDPKSFPLYGKENAIVVLNHTFEIDFLCGWTFCERFGVLGVRFSPVTFTKIISHSSQLLVWTHLACVSPELQGVSQERAELRPYHWLDVVLPGDSFLQEEMGRGPKDGGQGSPQPARLPWELLGASEHLEKPAFQVISSALCDSLVLPIISLWPPGGGPSFCSSVKARAWRPRSTRSACRWPKAKGCPNSSIIFCPGLKDSG